MALTGNITRRKGTVNYQARLRVPADLVDVLSRNELTKSLGTSRYREAKKLARVIVGQWESEFDDLRQRRNLTATDMRAAVSEHYRRELERDDDERLNRLPASEIEVERQQIIRKAERGEININDPLAVLNGSVDFLALRDQPSLERQAREIRAKALSEHLAIGESALIEYAADEFIERHKLTVQKGSTVYKELCHRLMRGEIEFLKRTFERDRGDYTGTPADPILSDCETACKCEKQRRVTKTNWSTKSYLRLGIAHSKMPFTAPSMSLERPLPVRHPRIRA